MDSRRNSLFDRDSWGISMKQKNTVVTLALLGVLALAARRGGAAPNGERSPRGRSFEFDLSVSNRIGG